MKNKIKVFFSKKANVEKSAETVDSQTVQQTDFSLENTFQAAIHAHQNGDVVNAKKLYQQVLQYQPHHIDSLHYLGILYFQTGNNDQALALINQAIQANPARATAAMYSNLGAVYKSKNQLEKAIESFKQALKFEPNNVNAHYNLGVVLQFSGLLEEAIQSYEQVILIHPNHAESCYNLGCLYQEQNNLKAAERYYRQAISLKPDYLAAQLNLGTVFCLQNKLAIAVEYYQTLLTTTPSNHAPIYRQLAIALQKQGYQQQAVENYKKAVSIEPDFIAYNNLGSLFLERGDWQQAANYLTQALSIKESADVYCNLATVQRMQHQWHEAINSYQKALAVQSDSLEARSGLLYVQLCCCDWQAISEPNQLSTQATLNWQATEPLAFLAMSDSPSEQQQCAQRYVAKKYPAAETLQWTGQHYSHDKIRIAYISGDFREHPVSFLMAGLFEQHNREQFEIIGISLKPEDKSPIGQRVRKAFDQFIDVSRQNDYEAALLIKNLEIDIAVDLMGFTQGSRTGIFAYCPAPVQVSYLGFPATMGADYIDYIIVDSYLIPPEYQTSYTEKVIYLPECFQANDDKRAFPADSPSRRASVGLPESGFVFCAFNNSYKFTPDFFNIWMRLLAKVENSVLWILEANALVKQNLLAEAVKRGISAERLIFAPRVKPEQHLARFQLADLFLDTLPCNAGTTASDALWAGVSVITCSGKAMASRMAGSLLHAVGLPELITHNLAEYEALALKLATHPEQLAAIKVKLTKNRDTYPLFNTARFARHLESAYIALWEHSQRGESPVSFAVPVIEQSIENKLKPLLPKEKKNTIVLTDATVKSESDEKAQYFFQRGNQDLAAGNFQQAIENYQQAVKLKPDFADAYCNLGVALKEEGQLDAAIDSYRHALEITPDDAEIHSNLGEVYWKKNHLHKAIECYQTALRLNPNAAIIYNNLGVAFKEQGKVDLAIANYRCALSIDSEYADAYCNLGYALTNQNKLDEALDNFKKAFALNPDDTGTLQSLIYAQRKICDWSMSSNDVIEKIKQGVGSGRSGHNPFEILALSSSPLLQLQCAQTCAKTYPRQSSLLWTGQLYRHDKIRVAYISADFREHPVSYLIAGLFEEHDRNKFEIIGISLQPEQPTITGFRVKNAFDQFIDVSEQEDYEVALLLQNLEVDIAVDLMGFTQNSRLGIFTYRPVPVQISYLGFSATLGTNYIDYIIADRIIIPPEQQIYYSEKIVYLPDTYMVNDSKRSISEDTPTRQQVGLPESGIVFCCFNNHYKITPDVFAVWMRLLQKVENSVLWLSGGNQRVEENLYKEAVAHGILAKRVIFAEKLEKISDHLARQKLADLFLDTLPYNAHSTTSDALWAGLPVLTCTGEAFASRVAASLLNAVGLAELITHSLEEYETLALKLATHPEQLAAIKAKLAKNRDTYPLFNTARFTHHLEAAYTTMWERTQLGEPPISFAVPVIEAN